MREHIINLEDAESDFLTAAAYLAESINSRDGHAEAMKEIVGHYLAKNEVDLAAELANTVDDTFIRDRLLSQVAEKCAALDDDEYALQLADAIEDTGFQAITRERIAAQKASKREFDKAFEIAESLPESSDALAEIAVQLAHAGNENEAIQAISQIRFHASKVNALQAIAAHYVEKGEPEKAAANLLNAAAEAFEIEFIEEKIRSLISISGHYIEAGKKDKAIELLDKTRQLAETLDNAHREGFLALISLDFLRAGSIDLADRTLDLVSDKTQIASCLASFAAEFDSRGERDEALDVLEEAYQILKSQRDNETRDSKAKYSVLGSVAVRYAILEKPERAVEIALENPVEDERYTALRQIARICALKNKEELSNFALKNISDETAQISALIALSDAKEKDGKRVESLKHLAEAESLAQAIPQLVIRAESLGELAARFGRFGEKEKSRELLVENLKTVTRILDESHKAVALANVAALYDSFGFKPDETERSLITPMLRKPGW